MELQGKIIAVLPERSGVSARGEWKVQEFVLETMDSQYPHKMVFDVFGAERLQRFNIQIGLRCSPAPRGANRCRALFPCRWSPSAQTAKAARSGRPHSRRSR